MGTVYYCRVESCDFHPARHDNAMVAFSFVAFDRYRIAPRAFVESCRSSQTHALCPTLRGPRKSKRKEVPCIPADFDGGKPVQPLTLSHLPPHARFQIPGPQRLDWGGPQRLQLAHFHYTLTPMADGLVIRPSYLRGTVILG